MAKQEFRAQGHGQEWEPFNIGRFVWLYQYGIVIYIYQIWYQNLEKI